MTDFIFADFALKNISDFCIRNLDDDDHFWRVDWFGQIGYPAEIKAASQPHIEVQFSKMSGDTTNLQSSFNISENQWPVTKTIRLPVGMLTMLQIGDVWHRGRHFASPEKETVASKGLAITRETAIIIKAGLSKENQAGEESFYLPIRHHPFHARHTHSYCVLVETGGVRIVIPAPELIRFYFGSSSKLLSRLFDGPFASENFWQRIDNSLPHTPTIHLAPGIPGQSAADVVRLALSRRAKDAGALISGSCMAAKVNGHPLYPKMIFPFIGETDLIVAGEWMPFDDQDRGIFLAFKILSCSHPFPFSKLYYTSERKSMSNSRNSTAPTVPNQDAVNKRYTKAKNDSGVITEEEPDKHKAPRLVGAAATTDAFPDLKEKRVAKIDPEHVPTVIVPLSGQAIIVGSSVGDSGANISIAPIDVVINDCAAFGSNSHSRPADIHVAVFLELIAKLAKLDTIRSVDIVPLHPRQRRDYLSPMPNIVDEDGVIHPSCFVNRANGKRLTRNSSINCSPAPSLPNIGHDTGWTGFVTQTRTAQKGIPILAMPGSIVII